MHEEKAGTCWNCGRALSALDYGRENTCPGCGKSTRACRNCRFFAPGRANECLEPMVERVVDKQMANYCEYFVPSSETGSGVGPSRDEVLRNAAENLFK